MEPIRVSCAGVAKLLRNLKPHKSTGLNGIPARLLLETADQIVPGRPECIEADDVNFAALRYQHITLN